LHRIRLTERKIAHRLELVETLVYRRRQPLPPLRFHPGDDPLVAPNVDNGDWPVIEPGACWGELGQDFTMRTTLLPIVQYEVHLAMKPYQITTLRLVPAFERGSKNRC